MSTWVNPLDPAGPIPGEPETQPNPNLDLAAAEAGYQPPSVEADQDAIAEQVYANLTTRAPGWQAHDANLDTWLIEAFAEVGSEIRALAANVPASIFATYGTNVLGIPPDPAIGSSGTATFTAIDNAGYTLDTGSQFALARAGDDLVAFQTLQAGVITPGATDINVPFTAVITGGDANGLTGPGQMLDPITWVAGITVTTPTAGGQDAETPQDYLDRLTNLLRMVALRPILPGDFAILALQNEGVARAVAMNLYDPVANTWTNERTLTLVLADPDGDACASDVKALVVAQIEALREVNWTIHVIDPTYDTLAVDVTAVAYAGQDIATVEAALVSNITAALSPATFRLGTLSPAISGGEVIPPPTSGPARRQVVRINDLIALADSTLGVDYVTAVTINGTAADHTLTSAYTLPKPGAITATVTGGLS